jgi:purine nucleoside phosphorylase
LKEKGVQQADFGLILGSGLGELANEITDAIAIPFSEIPHFSVSTVVGTQNLRLDRSLLVAPLFLSKTQLFRLNGSLTLSCVAF